MTVGGERRGLRTGGIRPGRRFQLREPQTAGPGQLEVVPAAGGDDPSASSRQARPAAVGRSSRSTNARCCGWRSAGSSGSRRCSSSPVSGSVSAMSLPVAWNARRPSCWRGCGTGPAGSGRGCRLEGSKWPLVGSPAERPPLRPGHGTGTRRDRPVRAPAARSSPQVCRARDHRRQGLAAAHRTPSRRRPRARKSPPRPDGSRRSGARVPAPVPRRARVRWPARSTAAWADRRGFRLAVGSPVPGRVISVGHVAARGSTCQREHVGTRGLGSEGGVDAGGEADDQLPRTAVPPEAGHPARQGARAGPRSAVTGRLSRRRAVRPP